MHRTHLVAHLQGRDDECRTLNADIAPELLADNGGEGVDAGVCEGQGDLNLRAFGEEGAVERDAWGELGIRIVGVEEGGGGEGLTCYAMGAALPGMELSRHSSGVKHIL